jgi:predicted ATPase/class 3 adenylate cyclase
MADLPTGTVTFLFSDIEGSTRLMQEIGDRYPALLAEHAAIIRAAVAEGGGVEIGTEGDSFFVVFRSPGGAVRAAVAAQRGLAAHDWSPDPQIRVRMGLHTGEGRLGGDSYAGLDVNRAARIEAAGHGGQILLSEATRGLVQGELPEGVTLRDLGEHRLKDIVQSVRLYDLAIDSLPSDFPSPRTLEARPNNLPIQLTSFVGREEQVAEIRGLLEATRLLTMTGPGGTGKSRLALQVAGELLSEFRDGATFVDLSSVVDPALVPSAMAQALRVPEAVDRPILEAVKDHLRDRELLLVVDNFEQVADAAPVLEEVLAAAPRVKALVTSRVVLSLRGEHEYAVPPLEPPDLENLPDLVTLCGYDAVRLFIERARAVQPRFQVTEENAPALAEITARLDGLPLAIELAATRIKVLTPEQMLPRLQQRLSILTTGPRTLPERQRTLRGAIAWSHDLLDAAERPLFARLSVFTGGWTLQAAEEVCEPESLDLDALTGLTSLVDKSLIRRNDPNGDPRFSMLETIREFGLEQLVAEEDGEAVRARHAAYYLDLAVQAEPHLTGADQNVWLDRCDVEHANIRAALRHAIDTGDAERAQAAAGALWRFWQQRGHLAEGRRWFEEILAMPSGQEASVSRSQALTGAGGVAWWQQDRVAAGTFYAEAVAIERELGDPARIAEALYNESFVVAGEDVEGAARMLDESLELFRSAGDERGVAQVLTLLVIRDANAGAWDRVLAKLEDSVAIWRRLGERLHLAFDMVWVGFAHGRLGHVEEGRAAALESLDLFREADNLTGVGIALTDLAWLALWEGRYEDSLRLEGASATVKDRVGGPPGGFAGILEGRPDEEARAKLPQEAADRAWDEGRGMNVDDAAALARAALQPEAT